MKRSYWPWLLIVGIVCLIVGILVWRGFREEEHPHKHGEGCHCYCFEQQGKEEDAHKHDAEHPVHIGHGAEKSSQVTVWTERFEIFLEHAFIVANTPTKFITHVSDLQTLKPRGKGPVTFILRRGSETPDKHIARAPVRDGIYIPELTFPLPGEWSLSLVIPLEGKDHLVELPPFEVYGSHEEVDRAPFPKEIAGISFLKEQQWKMLTRAEPVGRRKAIGQETLVVPESALIDENGKPVAFVQVAGETFEKRYLELGNRDNDFVEVLSGLSDGERVVTKGAYAIAEAERKKEHPHRHGEGCHCWCFEEGHPHRHDEGVHHEHEEEGVVQISTRGKKMIGLKTDKVAMRHIKKSLRITGEIAQDSEKLFHVTSNIPGEIVEVKVGLGDNVEKGTLLALVKGSKDGKIEEIKSPSGTLIIGQRISEGEEVDMLTSLFTIADISTMKASFDVYEKDIAIVKLGQKVKVKTRAYPGKIYPGEITFISPRVDRRTRTIKIRVDIDNYDHTLKLGKFVTGDIIYTAPHKMVSIANSAIQRWENEEIVFIPIGDNRYKLREIKLGTTGEEFSEVIAGLKLGEQVVTKGGFHLKAELQKAAIDFGAHGHPH